ncbi:WXG100 family type VII secretion target [Bacillus cereus]|uniref:WXG100 family type VII secretion target n=1 Tax=Bacillus cereus TaxID=1396 RepID=UPI002570CBF0|nr:WXG100 family type VII secretion target [Bacillus cereus]WJE28284.1 WXG100 family type VII secretion target [Bacillus cereus]
MIKERTKHERLNKDSEKVDNNNYFSTKLNSIVNKTSNSDNHIVFKNSGGLGVEPGEKSGTFAQAFKYETDIQLPKDMDTFSNDLTSFNKIGGEVKGAVVDAGFKVEDFTIHEQLLRAEVKAQFGGGIGGEAKAGVTFNDLGVDHDFGKAHIKVGNAEAGFEAKDGHIGIGVKADLVKGEAELKVPLPFTDWKVVVGGEAAYGREAKFGLMNEIDVGLGLGLGIGLGVKFGVEKD